MNSQEFSEEQKLYLQGFMSGSNLGRVAQGLPDLSATLAPFSRAFSTAPSGDVSTAPVQNLPEVIKYSGPDALGLVAQDRTLAEGKKLTEQEAAKRETHPLDQWDDIAKHAAQGRFPKGTDVLSFKYYGLFYVAPAQDSYMTRLRFAGGIITAAQMRVVSDVARQYGGNYAHVTTRANLQVREIGARDPMNVLLAFHDAGIINKGSGADNIRNVTGSATAGLDAQELIDTRPLTREMNHFILNHREMYGLPRKFNIAFDGGGTIHTLEDTNDIGFQAVRVSDGKSVAAGIYFRLMLGGITGHQDFARDTGILLKPEECVPMAAAILRVFIQEGDRTDRKKARLKYVLDRMGFDGFMSAVQKELAFEPTHFSIEQCEPRPQAVRNAHVGGRAQKQEGLFYIGVVMIAGRLEPDQMDVLAHLAERYGNGELRLTVWQNILLPNLRAADIESVKTELEAVGLGWKETDIRANLVACTGSWACKFGLADTKQSAAEIAAYVENRLQLDQPVNIHITGCINSCAQHYVGDIGLLGTKVEVEDDMLDGYRVFVGGGYGEDVGIGREVFHEILAPDAPRVVESMLSAYLENRSEGETFVHWARRYSPEQIKEMSQSQLVAA
ncbi:NAD(P)H-dependent nitrite reductase catalytic subunit [Abditibacterium utsteinense]|uniref:NAD(P)H-dependent nitrite reductase catalytic subunit n=1 Tax=Abditibacterium utsteinense TaxID=1960156 RepID=A0A2S8SR76_9BACT|nr:NirA family protein [Abditibacterium utsteinense]PQV63303.1 NAD(P)H-dependent nitrite reductase catalytic subunit [Abditibacterium utsteinense]